MTALNSANAFLGQKIHPKAFRIFFLGLALAGLVFIIASYFISVHLVQESLIEGKTKQMRSNVILLEENLSKSLDSVNAKLRSIAIFSTDEALRSGRLSSKNLASLIQDDGLIRSLAVVDERGRVVSSSSANDVGITLPSAVMPESYDSRSIGYLKIGGVYSGNSLANLGINPSESKTGSNPEIWLVTMTVPIDKRFYQIAAVININAIKNLWNQVDVDDTAEILLSNRQGTPLFAHQNGIVNIAELAKALGSQESGVDLGQLVFGPGGEFLSVFKTIANYDLRLSMTIKQDAIFSSSDPDRKKLRLAALVLSAGIIFLVLLRFSWYQRYESSLIRLKNQAEAVSSHLLMSESDLNGNIQYANLGFLEATGYRLEEILGKNYRILDSGLHSKTFFAGLWATLQSGQIWRGTLRNKKKSGEFFWVDVSIVPLRNVWGNVESYLTMYTNITESIAITEKYNQERSLREELAKVNRDLFNDVNTDSLTGIANRRALTSFIDKSIASSREFGSPISFLMLDLDHFKYINDNYGHPVGDLVLQEITARWKKQIRSSDMLARVGGEEFCIVLPQAGLQQAKNIAEKIRLATTQAAVRIRNHQELDLNISVSIGLASSEGKGQFDSTQLIEFADQALYRAKSEGRNQVIIAS